MPRVTQTTTAFEFKAALLLEWLLDSQSCYLSARGEEIDSNNKYICWFVDQIIEKSYPSYRKIIIESTNILHHE